jgi:beta-glucosidase/6-phospho-beta-glucosidase/beta-galactosidase
MATVSAVVYQDQKKADGTYNVKIRVFHRKEKRILDTTHFVTDRQLDKNYKIKDKQLNKVLDEILDGYRESITMLEPKLDFMHVEELKNYLRDKDKDFIAFCGQHIESLKKAKRNGTANNHRAVRNSLIDYFNKASVSIIEINS